MTPRAPRTVRVRVAVAVDREGNWYARGWNKPTGGDPEAAMHSLSSGKPGPLTLAWIWADLPIPEPAEVEAQVEGREKCGLIKITPIDSSQGRHVVSGDNILNLDAFRSSSYGNTLHGAEIFLESNRHTDRGLIVSSQIFAGGIVLFMSSFIVCLSMLAMGKTEYAIVSSMIVPIGLMLAYLSLGVAEKKLDQD